MLRNRLDRDRNSAAARQWIARQEAPMLGLAFDRDTHTYTLDGDRVPSVTTVLRAAGLLDFSHIPPTILEEARVRGDRVHSAVQYFNENDLNVAEFEATFPLYAPYLHAWIRFREERSFHPMFNEYRVASRRHRVAGTLDCLGVLDEGAVLVDFKTGAPADVAADLQTAAYYGLALETAQDDPLLGKFFETYPSVRRFAVQLRKDGSFLLEPYTAPTDYREFCTLVSAYHVVAKHRSRIPRDLPEVAA